MTERALADFRFPISNFQFPIFDFGFPISDLQFPIPISDSDFRKGFVHPSPVTRHNVPVPADQIVYVDGQAVSAFLPEGAAQPRVVIEGSQCVLNARIRRAFPLSETGKFVSIQDGAGKEVAMLRSMEGLTGETRRIFEHELDRRYFAPEILRIVSLKSEAGMWQFVVDTQRGPAKFYVRNWRDSAHEIGAGQWQINSVDGLRYSIPNLEELDEHSKDLLEQVF